jgi:hypothetical protein
VFARLGHAQNLPALRQSPKKSIAESGLTLRTAGWLSSFWGRSCAATGS